MDVVQSVQCSLQILLSHTHIQKIIKKKNTLPLSENLFFSSFQHTLQSEFVKVFTNPKKKKNNNQENSRKSVETFYGLCLVAVIF